MQPADQSINQEKKQQPTNQSTKNNNLAINHPANKQPSKQSVTNQSTKQKKQSTNQPSYQSKKPTN